MHRRSTVAILLLCMVVTVASVQAEMGLPCLDYWAKWCGKRPGKRSHDPSESSSSESEALAKVLLPVIRRALAKILIERTQDQRFDFDSIPRNQDHQRLAFENLGFDL